MFIRFVSSPVLSSFSAQACSISCNFSSRSSLPNICRPKSLSVFIFCGKLSSRAAACEWRASFSEPSRGEAAACASLSRRRLVSQNLFTPLVSRNSREHSSSAAAGVGLRPSRRRYRNQRLRNLSTTSSLEIRFRQGEYSQKETKNLYFLQIPALILDFIGNFFRYLHSERCRYTRLLPN